MIIFEILALILALTGIGTLARGKGVNPFLAGGIAFSGWWFIRFGVGLFVRSEGGGFLLVLIAWAWVAAVAGFLRFVMGAGGPKPDSKMELFKLPIPE
jgi:hypothetical protein